MVQKWVGKQQLFPTFLSCVLSWKSRKRDLGKTDVFEGGFPAWLQGVLQSAGLPERKRIWGFVVLLLERKGKGRVGFESSLNEV